MPQSRPPFSEKSLPSEAQVNREPNKVTIGMIKDNEPDAKKSPSTLIRSKIRSFRELLGPFALLGLWATIGPILGGAVLASTSHLYGPWLRNHEVFGIAGFTLAATILAAFAAAPTFALSIVAGWAFGFADGVVSMMLATVCAALIAWSVARFLASRGLGQWLSEHPKLRAVHQSLLGRSPVKAGFLLFTARLPPQIPFALLNLLAGSTRAPLVPFFVATSLGMFPRTALVTWTAATMESISFDRPETAMISILGLLIAAGLVIWIGVVARGVIVRESSS